MLRSDSGRVKFMMMVYQGADGRGFACARHANNQCVVFG